MVGEALSLIAERSDFRLVTPRIGTEEHGVLSNELVSVVEFFAGVLQPTVCGLLRVPQHFV